MKRRLGGPKKHHWWRICFTCAVDSTVNGNVIFAIELSLLWQRLNANRSFNRYSVAGAQTSASCRMQTFSVLVALVGFRPLSSPGSEWVTDVGRLCSLQTMRWSSGTWRAWPPKEPCQFFPVFQLLGFLWWKLSTSTLKLAVDGFLSMVFHT